MTLSEIQAFVRSAVLEKTNDVGLLPDTADLLRWVNAAHKAVYAQAVEWNPRPWFERSADVAYANPLPFATLAGAGKSIGKIHLVRVKVGSGYAPVVPLEAGEIDFADIEEGTDTTANSLTSRWYVEGKNLWLTPPPNVAVELRVSFVREIGALASPANDETEMLGGHFGDHHEVVGFKAAQLVYRKDEVRVTPWDLDVEDGLRALRSALARNQGQRTRRIRRASHFPSTRRR